MSERREEWRRRVARWRASGLSAKEFAAKHGLNPSTLGWWRSELRREDEAGSAEPAGMLASALVEVMPVEGDGNSFVIELDGGRRLHVPPTFDDVTLRGLLKVLERRA